MGFNYQAIARNGNGVPITSQAIPVRISIVASLTGGTVIWQEDHSSVTADQYGLISLVVGTGTRTGGLATSFSAIDWSAQTLFLKTEVKYPGPGWTDMGTSQIWAVPYSLVAKNIEGPLAKLGITGTTDNMDEALFEVKNKAGNTVFAVYNEGVRVYVGNGDAKGVKGGFSVGGYDGTKGIHNLLTVTSDSVRVYVDNNPSTKGTKGGFSVGGYDMTKSGVQQNYLDVSSDSVRIYIDNTDSKGKKGGFAVGGFDMTKGSENKYLSVSPDSTMVYLQSQSNGSSSTFNIVALNEDNGRKYLLQANTDTVGITGVLNVKNNLVVSGNIKISGSTVQDTSLVTDMDGNTYKTIRIGQQIWMAEDLKTSKYNDGTAIPLVTNNTEWAELTTPGYCWYNNDAATYKATYGALYNWYTVNTGKLCPTGWHVPTDAEWAILITYLGGESVAGDKLRETGTTGATNESGFTALPSGYRYDNGTFYYIGDELGAWWSATKLDASELLRGAWYHFLINSDPNLQFYNLVAGLNARCLRDY